MKLSEYDNNEYILKELGNRIRNIRIARSVTREDFAKSAGISVSTMKRVEDGGTYNIFALLAILREMGLLGNLNTLIPEQDITELDLNLRREAKQRVRASKAKNRRSFEWGDEKA